MDNYVALQDFFDKFPEFKKNPFFVTGESYGGVYVPTLSYRILQGNATINMKVFVKPYSSIPVDSLYFYHVFCIASFFSLPFNSVLVWLVLLVFHDVYF